MSTFKPDFTLYPLPETTPRFEVVPVISKAEREPVGVDAWPCGGAAPCSRGVVGAACVPPFDPRAACWESAFTRTVFVGDADPLGWLTAHHWAQWRLALAVRGVAAEVRSRWDVATTFVFTAEWDYESPLPDVSLRAYARVFSPCEYGSERAEAVDAVTHDLTLTVARWTRPLESPTFGGAAGRGVWFSLDLTADLDFPMSPRVRDLLQRWVAEASLAEGPILLAERG